MSAQTIMEAFAPAEADYKRAVMAATWGHLAPERGVTYRGAILFAHGGYGDLVPLDASFEGLPDSPWFFDDMMDWIAAQKTEPGNVYLFTGTYRQHRFRGKVRRVEMPGASAALTKAREASA